MEITITCDNFSEEVLSSQIPVVVDFWAPWCGPCRMLAPGLAQIAQQYEGKLKVGKVNVDEQMPLAQQFGIASIPTLLLFENGQLKDKSVGFLTPDQLKAWLGL